jgi:hypothetical protein
MVDADVKIIEYENGTMLRQAIITPTNLTHPGFSLCL